MSPGGTSPKNAPQRDARWDEHVHRVHDRYLVEVVEGLNLCPFARRCRELGRVHRPIFWPDEDTMPALQPAQALAAVTNEHPDAEIVLLTFVVGPTHPWQDASTFDQFARSVQDAYHRHFADPRFYMVSFHPCSGLQGPSKVTVDSLVPLLRRTPDPVIQCVRGEVLDAARAQAQERAAQRRQREIAQAPPALHALLAQGIQTESELSSDIAHHNFVTVGADAGRTRLESLIHALQLDRERSYGSIIPKRQHDESG